MDESVPARSLLRYVWVTAAFRPYDRLPYPEIGMWAHASAEAAVLHVKALNAPGSWLRAAGYRCRKVGRFARSSTSAKRGAS